MNNRSGWDLGLACCTSLAQRGSGFASRSTFFTLPRIGNICGISFSSIGIDWKVVPRFKLDKPNVKSDAMLSNLLRPSLVYLDSEGISLWMVWNACLAGRGALTGVASFASLITHHF